MEKLPPGDPVNLILLGRTGHGKSATGNSIFGRKIFNSSISRTSGTQKCQLESGLVGERRINLVDTPGLMDVKDIDATLKEIGTAISLCPEGFHAFLLVLRPDVRMTAEEWMSITLLKKLFGKDVLKQYSILLFTRGDTFKEDADMNGMNILEWLDLQGPEIAKLVDECNKRCFIINNRETDPGTMRKEIIELISLVDRLVKENAGQMYSSDLFKLAQLEKIKEIIKEEKDYIKNEEKYLQQSNDQEEFPKIQGEVEIPEELNKLKANQNETNANKLVPVSKDYQIKTVREKKAQLAMENGRSCFPPNALVKLEDGKVIAMADLQVGHKVLSSVSHKKLEYSEVYFFAHLDPWKQSQYICIFASKYKLKLTPDHHIFIVGTRNSLDTVPAGKINIGDRILIFDEVTAAIQEETVTHLSRSTEVGIYAPITMSGSIIVDNVLVSCYVDAVPPTIAHSLLWPMRKLYQFSPSCSAWVNMESNEGMPIWVQCIIASCLRWLK